MHKGIAVGLCALLLTACAQWQPQKQGAAPEPPEKEVAVPVVIEVPPPEEMQQLSELVLDGQRVSRLDAAEQKRELAKAQKAYAGDKRDVHTRVRLGMLHALPGKEEEEFSVRGRATRSTDPALRPIVVAAAVGTVDIKPEEWLFEYDIEEAATARWENLGQPDTRAIRRRWVAQG